MRPARGMRLVGVLAVGGLVLAAAGCGKPPAKNSGGSTASGKKIHACMVTDTGGINDRSFNSSAWAGMQAAKAANANVSVDYVQSAAEADYQPNLTQFVNQKCDLIVAVGGLMGDATTAAAKANPNQMFAIIDDRIDLPNVYSMQFDTAQAAFLAGYLAAGMSKTGTVATYGGLKIPPVTIFMDGFADGVAYYNQAKGKNVKVLGWDKAAQNGSFANSFTDQNAGKQLSDAFVAQGADVILPVAGGTGAGTAAAAQQSGGKYAVIWVDQDGCVSAQTYCSVFLSTVVKNIADTVKDAVLKTASGSLHGGTGSIGTLANNGVQLAPYHDFDAKVPADLKAEIEQLKQDIISGKVKVSSPAQPAAPSAGGVTAVRRHPVGREGVPLRLELRGITRRFGDVVANDHIDLVVEPGEIHALLGENGAGKSTLMNVLYGLLQPDQGEIVVDGHPVRFKGPGDAIAAGIGMVHQHFMLVPVFTVTENIMLGAERTRAGFLDRAAARQRVLAVSSRYGLPVDPDATVADLPVGLQQRVEIVKALVREVDLLILDEPTAVLTPQETDELISVMRGLKADGKSIVFITHKLKEVKAVADRITVVRRGRIVGTARPDASEDALAALMVGRTVRLQVDKAPAQPGEPVLTVSGLTVYDERGHRAVDGVDLVVRRGEVLGVAGVHGNGQTELVQAIMGLRPVAGGTVEIDGEQLGGRSTREILRAGVGYIPEDRSADGLIRDFSVAENLVLDVYDQPPYASGLVLSPSAITNSARHAIAQFDVRTASAQAPVGTLSGGNQQKVIVARELGRPLRLLIAAQPTRGVDVGSTEFIHSQVVRERDRGAGVLLVSSELDEVLALADRIAVMCRGKILAILPADPPREQVGLLMAGITQASSDGSSVTS